MYKILIILIFLSLTSCGFIIPFEYPPYQGQIIEQSKIEQIKVGMSKTQVEQILEQSIAEDDFNPNLYLYFYSKSGLKKDMKKLQLKFDNQDKLTTIEPII